MIIFLVFFGLVLAFGFVVLFGAPYLPTHRSQAERSLELAKVSKGTILYELGCGDGLVLRMAARRGAQAVGYELNPILFIIAWLGCLKYRGQISVRFGNYWGKDISEADVVYVFLLDRFMSRLDLKLRRELKAGSLLISYTFKIPRKKPLLQEGAIHIYQY